MEGGGGLHLGCFYFFQTFFSYPPLPPGLTPEKNAGWMFQKLFVRPSCKPSRGLELSTILGHLSHHVGRSALRPRDLWRGQISPRKVERERACPIWQVFFQVQIAIVTGCRHAGCAQGKRQGIPVVPCTFNQHTQAKYCKLTRDPPSFEGA